ncbi:MAG: 30S ribosome-binding factor RbfA [Verrucomicrobiae bacterium]|nr:30S ribosome-binding factor RbfA [Verrucomicrobiae bacterium]
MESNNRRLARVRELLKQEVAGILREVLPIEEVGLLTVNAVGVGRDLRSAIVFLGFVGTKAQRKRAPEVLAERTGLIRARVGASVRLKFTPELRFQIDDSIEQGNRVLALLDELERQSPGPSPNPDPGPPPDSSPAP